MRAYSTLVLMALFLGACGDDAGDDDGSGGSGTGGATGGTGASGGAGGSSGGSSSTGGSSGATGGGSSGATGGGGSSNGGSSNGGSSNGGSSSGESVRGAVSLEILAPKGCSLTAQTLDLPAVASGHPVSMNDRSGAIENGAMSADGEVAEVYCIWSGKAAPYTISAGITIGVGVAKKVVTFTSSMVEGSPMAGGITVATPDLEGNYVTSSEGPCMFTPIEVDETTRSVWGQFSCDVFTDATRTDPCAIGPSFYTFENCSPP